MKQLTITQTSWGTEYKIAKCEDEFGTYIDVEFSNGQHHRTRKSYSPTDADSLMKAIVVSTKKTDFPFTDKNGKRQWISYDPNTIVNF